METGGGRETKTEYNYSAESFYRYKKALIAGLFYIIE